MDWAKEAEQMKEISMDFFRDEVRNGFFIPTAVKQRGRRSYRCWM